MGNSGVFKPIRSRNLIFFLKEKIKTLLHLARKVYRYRKDVLPAENLDKLKTSISKLEESLEGWLKLEDDGAQKRLQPELEKLHDELKTFLTKIRFCVVSKYAILHFLTSCAHYSSVIRECLSVSDSHKRFSSLPSNGGFYFT